MRNTLVIALIIFTTAGCAIPKKKPVQPEIPLVEIKLTPGELADALAYRDQKTIDEFNGQISELRKDFDKVTERMTKLKREIKLMIKDCLCPAEMK